MWIFLCGGNFHDMTFLAKIPPEEKPHKTLLRKKVKYYENYPHVKGLANIFAKFFPNENNYVYSNYPLYLDLVSEVPTGAYVFGNLWTVIIHLYISSYPANMSCFYKWV